ncbi:ribonuclease HII [archaeon]|jgi:ribonuclease HII|nr:ribonuclease HII [archaeon]MBT4397566.1 ribonuclease HII [archaeon]MBT4440821.1 ribonuclease HII [archaeon]
MTIICGVDEAGRGPLIGPLVVAGVAIDEKDLPKLLALNPKDSKLLSPKQRDELFPKIKEITKYKIFIIPPQEIDDALNSPTLNLNWLEAIKYAMTINYLKADTAYVDCPSNNNTAFKDYMENLMKQPTKLIVENKADDTYPIVSAASILAKVTRDAEVKKLREKYGDLGSGYPADPKTKEFLKKYHKKYPEIFRKTWASYKRVQQTTLI